MTWLTLPSRARIDQPFELGETGNEAVVIADLGNQPLCSASAVSSRRPHALKRQRLLAEDVNAAVLARRGRLPRARWSGSRRSRRRALRCQRVSRIADVLSPVIFRQRGADERRGVRRLQRFRYPASPFAIARCDSPILPRPMTAIFVITARISV